MPLEMALSQTFAGGYELHPDTCILSARQRPGPNCDAPATRVSWKRQSARPAIEKMVRGEGDWLRTLDEQEISTVETAARGLPGQSFDSRPVQRNTDFDLSEHHGRNFLTNPFAGSSG
jgi:hypothetical protein